MRHGKIDDPALTRSGEGMSTRRSILKLIGMSPVAGKTAIAEIGAALSSPAGMLAGTLSTATLANVPAAPGHTLGLFGDTLRNLKRQHDDEQQAIWATRQGYLDPDISCLKSVSPVRKARLQMERDLADRAMLRQVDKLLWGE